MLVVATRPPPIMCLEFVFHLLFYIFPLLLAALICEEFLERTAAQLTYHGLSELGTTVKEDELCVFFRNNHFSTLYKYRVRYQIVFFKPIIYAVTLQRSRESQI